MAYTVMTYTVMQMAKKVVVYMFMAIIVMARIVVCGGASSAGKVCLWTYGHVCIVGNRAGYDSMTNVP